MCTNASRSAIEKACRSASAAAVAERFGVNENALVRHLASHVKPATKGKPARKPVTIKARLERVARPRARLASADVVDIDDEDLDELAALAGAGADDDDEEAPATSRSPSRPITARSTLDDILREIRTLMKSANGVNVPFTDKTAALRAALQATKLLASLTGELGATEATVASSPHFKRMLQVILEAVSGARFADARQAIIGALEQAERGGAQNDQAAE